MKIKGAKEWSGTPTCRPSSVGAPARLFESRLTGLVRSRGGWRPHLRRLRYLFCSTQPINGSDGAAERQRRGGGAAAVVAAAVVAAGMTVLAGRKAGLPLRLLRLLRPSLPSLRGGRAVHPAPHDPTHPGSNPWQPPGPARRVG